ncbi:hypothetical protein EWB00_005540 [Schistosoma japonicum]|uniref:Uncharacterized protein n=1 Tax=Schistosoma japonicum TaxID=6182 RepID=A0A4Z2D1B0_SCHJA|nr:hypothetical protein EWB00_005540 [Schistosoma japonicum]
MVWRSNTGGPLVTTRSSKRYVDCCDPGNRCDSSSFGHLSVCAAAQFTNALYYGIPLLNMLVAECINSYRLASAYRLKTLKEVYSDCTHEHASYHDTAGELVAESKIYCVFSTL